MKRHKRPRGHDLPVIRGMVIARVLSARTLDGCARGDVLSTSGSRPSPRTERCGRTARSSSA